MELLRCRRRRRRRRRERETFNINKHPNKNIVIGKKKFYLFRYFLFIQIQ